MGLLSFFFRRGRRVGDNTQEAAAAATAVAAAAKANADVLDVEATGGLLPVQHSAVPAQCVENNIKMDKMLYGALMCLLSIALCYSPIALVAKAVNGDQTVMEHVTEVTFASLASQLLQMLSAMNAVVFGFIMLLIAPSGPAIKKFSWVVIFSSHFGVLSLLIHVTVVIKELLAEGNPQSIDSNMFIPASLNPTFADKAVAAICGITSVIAVCVTLVGGLIDTTLCIHAIIHDRAIDKNKLFFLKKLKFHCLLVVLGGLAQVVLAVYLMIRFGVNAYDEPISVGVFTIFRPSLAAVTGLVQTAFGLLGLIRAYGFTKYEWTRISGPSDYFYMYVALIAWVFTMFLQIIVQPSHASGDSFASEGATYALVYTGYFVMPLWYEYKVRNTPLVVDPTLYGLPAEMEPNYDSTTDHVLKWLGMYDRIQAIKNALHSLFCCSRAEESLEELSMAGNVSVHDSISATTVKISNVTEETDGRIMASVRPGVRSIFRPNRAVSGEDDSVFGFSGELDDTLNETFSIDSFSSDEEGEL